MHTNFSHEWIIAPYQRDRQAALNSMSKTASVTYRIDCHRNLRGPYTGAGELLRSMVPRVYHQWPDLVLAHGTEILSMAPELKPNVAVSKETLTSLAIPEERTRFYSRLRTLRLTHGLVDFLLKYRSLAKFDHFSIFFENVDLADVLDQEFIAVLLRRADPRLLSVTVGTSSDSLPNQLQTALTTYAHSIRPQPMTIDERQHKLRTGNIPIEWQQWLLQHTDGWLGEWEPFQNLAEILATISPEDASLEKGLQTIVGQCSPATRDAMAQAYVTSDCTSDDLLERTAYQLLEPAVRQQLHDVRAEELEQLNQWSLHLGAIPYHREHGQDPSGTGAQALIAALDYCINMGYYEATVDLGRRGRKLIDWEKQLGEYWTFTTKMTTSLAALARPAEAEVLYKETRALTSNHNIHMQAAYATSMLYTRHYEDDRRDHLLAKEWINEAIAIARLLPDPKDSAFNTVFNENGLALIEVRLGRPYEALRLVTEGLEHLNQVLEPGEHLLHRSVLLYNRGQVYAGLGQLEKALEDYSAVIAQDSHYSEYYFDRGNIYRRLGRNDEALEDYNHAIEYSPPYPEAYYNRAGVLSLKGRDDEALSDYSYVLELDPTYTDALVNRASLLYEREDYAGSRKDVERGLALDPGNPQLLCTLGLLEMAEQHPGEAHRALTSALERDPSLIAAWTNRAVLAYEGGDTAAAIDDLTHALALGENAVVLYNRGMAYESQQRWQDAITDYSCSLALADDDAQDILYQRGLCHLKLGDTTAARQDFEAHLALGPSPYLDELRQLDLSLPIAL